MSKSSFAEDNSTMLSKAYEPAEVERTWYARWMQNRCFHANASSNKEAYSIVIPPPNVTGILHLGHVLNNTLQDILCRRARQSGKEVLWLPGTDHAGIATQTKVEREIRRTEGKSRHDLGREEFLQRVWKWKEDHGNIIFQQLQRLGCSLDWDRQRFTMDDDYSHNVSSVFSSLFDKGLIYRGKRMVNWCPVSLTALSDEEVIMKPQQSILYTMKYEIVEEPGRFLEIATTRPETLMGDVAVAVHPDDPRHADLIGKHARRPFPEANIPIIADNHVDKEFGTGALKVTPAHDHADFEIGLRHNLEIIDVLTPDGKINCPDCPDLHGLDREIARKKAAHMLAERKLLLKEEPYENNVGFSERADVPIEPRISMQWFLRYPATSEAANAVASNTIEFRPQRWRKTYAHWMENLKDWCISRQLWWGHRIPVWYRKDEAAELLAAENLDHSHRAAGKLHVGTNPPPDPENWLQDEDSLDTWFSSWLWPFATMDEPTRKKFYPTTDLVTGPDIIFFWVARMIMAGFEFTGQPPFKHVFFTSIIRDLEGRKMSKSLGNSPDPIELIDRYGADGLRFGLLRISPVGTDVRFDEKQIEEGRNFANKLWNASRFRQMQGECHNQGTTIPNPDQLGPLHIDILAKLDALQAALEKSYANYQFGHIAQALYDFFWNDYCDTFLEAIKGDFREGANPENRTTTLAVIDLVLRRFLQLLHPFMPHLTEELWEKLGFGDGTPLMLTIMETTPTLHQLTTPDILKAQTLTRALYQSANRARNLKAEYNLAANKNVVLHLRPALDNLQPLLPTLALLAGAREIILDHSDNLPANAPQTLTDFGQIAMPLEGLIDTTAEMERLGKEIEKIELEIEKCSKKLVNPNFIARANPEVVAKEKERLEAWQDKRSQLFSMLDKLA